MRKQHSFYSNTFFTFVLGSTLLSDAVLAAPPKVESTLPTVIVTADFRPSDLQETAGSISVVSAQELRSRGAQHLEDILNLAPNLNFSSGSSRARFYQIRGIGERSEFGQSINPSVGLLIDGINLSGIGTAATILDTEKVEVLRGPQGTRFGANALAGIINIQTKTPVEETQAELEATVAEHGTQSLALVGNIALIPDQLFARVALRQHESDGFLANSYLGRDDTNERDESTARLRLRWVPNADTTVDLTLLQAKIDNGYDAFSLDNNRRTLSDQPGRDEQDTDAYAINVNWNVNSKMALRASVSGADSDILYSYDEDWSYQGIAPGWDYSTLMQYARENDNQSFELQLLSNDEGRLFSDSTGWVVGMYHFNREVALQRTYIDNYNPDENNPEPVISLFDSQYDTTNSALFAQFDTELTDKLSLITGVRGEQWDATYQDSVFDPDDPDETLAGGKIGLEYLADDSNLFYTSINRGYKAGGVNTESRFSTIPKFSDFRFFDTEFQTSMEVGIKTSLPDLGLQTRLSVFYAKRKDMQVKGSEEIAREHNPSSEFLDYITNAGKGKNYGLEAEFNWSANESWKVLGSLGLLRAKLDDYTTPDGVDMSGRDQAHAPRYQYFLASEHSLPSGIFFRTEIEGKDGFNFSNRHLEQSQSYALLNARAGYRAKQWQIALWVRNLTDKEYRTRGFGFANDPRDEYVSSGYTQLGDPRVTGITFNWQL